VARERYFGGFDLLGLPVALAFFTGWTNASSGLVVPAMILAETCV
jgi:hypothetical protein